MVRLVVLSLLLVFSGSVEATPPPKPKPKPKKARPYAKLDRLLKTWVDAQGMVDYAGFKKKDEGALRACVRDLAKVDPKALSKKARKAYWINVYNAVTLQAMLEFHPVSSILKIKKGYDVFKQYPFGKQRITLDSIEHKVLRPMGDPRIHSAIVCASKGCPPLRNEAYVPARLDAQLDANVRTWFKSPTRGLKIRGNTAYISEIFNWFGKDFGPKKGHLRWIAKYVDKATRKKLLSGLKVKYIKWDWTPNQQE